MQKASKSPRAMEQALKMKHIGYLNNIHINSAKEFFICYLIITKLFIDT